MKQCKQKVLKRYHPKRKRADKKRFKKKKKKKKNISVQTKKFQKYQLKTVQNT